MRLLRSCLVVLLAAGCLGRGRRGPIDASPFVPASDAQIQQLLGDYPSPGPNVSRRFIDVEGVTVELPAARVRYADEVVGYAMGSPAPIAEGQDPRAALGAPDYTPNKWDLPHAVTLGNGGALTLKWNHGALVDGPGPDLFIFEIGPMVEAMHVEVSADGLRWLSVGDARGGLCTVDIGPYVHADDVFSYVRLRDIPFQGAESEAWPGADIDAVAVLGAARRVSVPSEVLFAFDSDTLGPGASDELDRVVAAVREEVLLDEARVTVEGHTDDVGTDAYNQELSERRARAVAEHLARKGVRRDRIEVKGYGKSRPVAGTDDAGRRQNRRVEIVARGRVEEK